MKPILTALSPNTESDDITLALRVLFSPWSWKQSQSVSRVEQKLSTFLNNQAVATTSSGRTALTTLLKNVNISKNDEVIIQAFTCLAVPASIIHADATPIYADINPSTYNLDPADVAAKITDNTRAIIIQHTFGIPGPIKELKQLCEAKKILLIEDCAHALGQTVNDQPLGTFGDAAIYSFGRDKTISSVFGGAISSPNAELIHRIKVKQDSLSFPPFLWTVQQLFHPLAFSIIKPLYFAAGLGQAILTITKKLRLTSLAVSSPERSGKKPKLYQWRYSPALAQLAAHQIDKLERYSDRRRSIAQQYDRPGFLRVPVTVRNPKAVIKSAKRSEILLGDWYNQPVTPCNTPEKICQYQPGSCPNAEKAAETIINLPSYPTMTDDQVERVRNFLHDHANS